MRNDWLKANSGPGYNARYSEYGMNIDYLDVPYNKAIASESKAALSKTANLNNLDSFF